MNKKYYKIEYTLICATLFLFAILSPANAFDVRIIWDESTSEGVTGYNIYRTLDQGSYTAEKKIGSVDNETLEYVDTNLNGGIAYYYVITAVGSDNAESEYSDEIVVEPADYGDLNNDGNITPGDALLILKIYDQTITPDKKQEYSGDMTHDGKITPIDALCVLKIFIKDEDPNCS